MKKINMFSRQTFFIKMFFIKKTSFWGVSKNVCAANVFCVYFISLKDNFFKKVIINLKLHTFVSWILNYLSGYSGMNNKIRRK